MIASRSFSVLQLQLLIQLGASLRRLRKAQGGSAVEAARRLGISRTTLSAVEAGDAAPSMGTFLRVMSAVGIDGDMAFLTSEALRPATLDTAVTPSQDIAPFNRVVISADTSRHRIQDLQSLALHEEAVRSVRADPALLRQAQIVLQRWINSGDQRSASLWLEWKDILEHGKWRKALGRTQRAQALRQASPLATVLPPAVRQRILSEIHDLKKGVVFELRDGSWVSTRPSESPPTNARNMSSKISMPASAAEGSPCISSEHAMAREDDITTLAILVNAS